MALQNPSQQLVEQHGSADSFAALIKQSGESADGSREARLPVAPNFKFFLHHWPQEWSVGDVVVELEDEDGKTRKKTIPVWLPGLAKHVVRPGINLNRTLKVGQEPRAAYDGQVLANMRKGSVYLDLSDFRTRLPDGRYYRSQAPARDPKTGREGDYFMETVRVPRDKVGNKRLKLDTDRALYNRWRRDLVRLGVFQPPGRAVRNEKIAFLKTEVGRCAAMTKLDPAERKRRIKEAETELDRHVNAEIPTMDPAFLAEVQARYSS